MGFVHWTPNVTGDEKSSLTQDLNLGPLAHRAGTSITMLLRPDILTDSHTPVNLVASIYCQ